MRKEDLLKYWFSRMTVILGGDVPIPAYCNAIVATNIGPVGGAVAFVNGYPINPPLVAGTNGESYVIGGGYASIMSEEQLEIIFGAGVSRVFVSMLFYTNIC